MIFRKFSIIIFIGLLGINIFSIVTAIKDAIEVAQVEPENEEIESTGRKRVKRDARFQYKSVNEDPFKAEFMKLEQADLQWTQEAHEMISALRFEHSGEGHPIDLNWTLVSYAQQWAITLGKESGAKGVNHPVLRHDWRIMHEQGELMGARRYGTREQLTGLPGSFPVRIWHEELNVHDWNDNNWKWNTGHFSQVIWQNSLAAGCGRYITGDTGSECDGEKWVRPPIMIYVCRFEPPGNWKSAGAYRVNVLKPKNEPENGHWDYSKFCNTEKNQKPCPRPHVCCTDKSHPINFTMPCHA